MRNWTFHWTPQAALALLLTLVAPLGLRAAEAPVPVAEFFKPDEMSQPRLSPSGKYLAVLVAAPSGRRQLAVMSLAPPRTLAGVAGFKDADVANVHWVNDDRLVFNLQYLDSDYGDWHGSGLFAVDRTGLGLRRLIKTHNEGIEYSRLIVSRELEWNHSFFDVVRDGSPDVVIKHWNFDRTSGDLLNTTLMRLNTLTGQATTLATGFDGTAMDWDVDSLGRAREAETHENGKTSIHFRPKPEAPWELVPFSDDANVGRRFNFTPEIFGPDNELYVVQNDSGPDRTSALFLYDAAAKRVAAEPLVRIKGFDFDGHLIFDGKTHRLLGVRYTSDALTTTWVDPGMKALQDKIDARVGDTINLIDIADCGCSNSVLVTSYSDRQPPVYLLFNRDSGQLEMLGQARPGIHANQMSQRDFSRIPVRDGHQMPVHITRPNVPGPWPTVVLVHGGPYLRGKSWQWYADSQFLASRGYLVVEPEFRGSKGFGDAWYHAGFKQWGLAMQDDIADATRWVIDKGLADPKRVCIAGGSYGGYATLMGLIRYPDLYRCGVATAAVTDLNLFVKSPWSDMDTETRKYSVPIFLGDPVKDADQFAATSPTVQAARLRQPLLLAHGGLDHRVPLEHGTRMRDALSKTNDKVEWLQYPGEGHGWFNVENEYDYWTRVEKFLARNLATAP